jgi:hypothetical protein
LRVPFAVYANEGDKILKGLGELFIMMGVVGTIIVGIILWVLFQLVGKKPKQKSAADNQQLLDDDTQ